MSEHEESEEARLDAVDAALRELAANESRKVDDAEFLVAALERLGYQITRRPRVESYAPNRPSNVTRIGLRGTTTWISIGPLDGYFRAVVEMYADDEAEYVASCSHRHMDKTKALLCAARMVRVRERRDEKLAAWEQRRAAWEQRRADRLGAPRRMNATASDHHA